MRIRQRLKKAANRVKRVLRKTVQVIEVPREDVWERLYPDERAGWETKGRYYNSGESKKKGEIVKPKMGRVLVVKQERLTKKEKLRRNRLQVRPKSWVTALIQRNVTMAKLSDQME